MFLLRALTTLNNFRAIASLAVGALFGFGLAGAGLAGGGRAGEIVPAFLIGVACLAVAVWLVRRDQARRVRAGRGGPRR